MNFSISNPGNSSPDGGSDSAHQRRQRMSEFDRKKSGNPAYLTEIRSENGPVHRNVQEERFPMTARSDERSASRATSTRLVFLYTFVALGLILFSLCAGFAIGHLRGKASAERGVVAARMQTLKPLPANENAVLNRAVAGLRTGQAESSFAALKDLRARYPQTASLNYLIALAALETGRYVVAETHVKDSIKAGQRVSDSLALLSMLERRKASAETNKKPDDFDRKGEELLRAAITSDSANPHPHIELANLLRVRGNLKEAEAEFQAAQALLTPMDSHLVVDLTLAVMQVEQRPVGELTTAAPATADVRSLFPAAYTAMRMGDMALAGSLLEQCRELLQDDLFNYLMSDPSVRKFADRQELQGFYAQR